DAHGGRKDISTHPRSLFDEYGFLRVQIAVDRALDNDELRTNIRFDRALRTDGKALGVGDRALDAPLNQQILFGGQIALEVQGRAQDRRPVSGGIVGIAHCWSPGGGRETGPKTTRHNRSQNGTWITFLGAAAQRLPGCRHCRTPRCRTRPFATIYFAGASGAAAGAAVVTSTFLALGFFAGAAVS